MGTEKRQRQKENRQKKREQQAKIETRDNLRQRILVGIGFAALAALGIFFLSRGGDDPTTAAASSATTILGATTTTQPAVPVSDIECPAADGSSAQTLAFDAAPPMCIDVTKTYTAEMVTSEGTVTIELDATKAPNTVNNFVFLSRYHYYDGARFHRVINDFMIQGGDPVGNPAGTGNPGYRFNDELPAQGDYQVGSIAMANSGANTNGSQFFIVTGAAGVNLPPQYSLFGQVTEGLDVVKTIEAVETDDGDAPLTDVVIESVTISES
ncbi:MAG: peptidylprolyl isomerase [Acidimicrobiales bacterium]